MNDEFRKVIQRPQDSHCKVSEQQQKLYETTKKTFQKMNVLLKT